MTAWRCGGEKVFDLVGGESWSGKLTGSDNQADSRKQWKGSNHNVLKMEKEHCQKNLPLCVLCSSAAGLDNMRDAGMLHPRHFYTIYAIFTRFTRFLHDFMWFLHNFTRFLRFLHDFTRFLRNFTWFLHDLTRFLRFSRYFLPGKKFSIPGTKNYFQGLDIATTCTL